MINDETNWHILNQGFCSFKVKLKQPPQTFCRNEYNVTGLCNRVSCPLANSEYATVLEKEGLCYLYIKTVERAHTPRKLWEKIELSKNFMQALTQIDEHLMHWADHKKNRCKQRLTKLRQVLLRQRKAALEPKLTTTVGVKKKTERREATREAKAEKAAKVETAIEKELLERLKLGTYGDLYKTNEQRNAEKDAARSKRRKEDEVEMEDEDAELEQELEYEDDDEAARLQQLEDEDEEVDERDLAYVADMGDDDDSDDDGIPDEDLSDLSDVADLSELSDDDADDMLTPATRASSTGGGREDSSGAEEVDAGAMDRRGPSASASSRGRGAAAGRSTGREGDLDVAGDMEDVMGKRKKRKLVGKGPKKAGSAPKKLEIEMEDEDAAPARLEKMTIRR